MPFLTTNLRELVSPARKFLFFAACNTVTWQCIASQALVLFAREIRMPEFLVGCLIAFMPLCMILIIFTAPWVERFGPKNLMTIGWLARGMSASLVFFMPWAIAIWGDPGGWIILLVAILGYCVIRALTVSGWFPWLHEIVPPAQRGLYFSLEMATMQAVNVVLALVLGLILSNGAGLNRFYLVYAIGVIAGLLSLILIRMIPGGEKFQIEPTHTSDLRAYLRVLMDSSFMQFCFRSGSGMICLSLINASSMMYLRDELGMSPGRAMLINSAAALTVAVTIQWWGRYMDRHGSGPAMFLSLTGHSLSAGLWLVLIPGRAWSLWLAWPAYVLFLTFYSSFQIAKNQGLLARIQEQGKVAYTNIYIISDALAMGLTPIAAGALIEYTGLFGFRVCFALACVGGIMLALPNLWARDDGALPAPYMGPLIRTTLPLRAMARALWFSMGLFSGNRRSG